MMNCPVRRYFDRSRVVPATATYEKRNSIIESNKQQCFIALP